MSLTYSLLLKLDHGPATVVENLSDEEVAALRVDTPVTRFVSTFPEREVPRHLFLTGNAGDGKTFALRSAIGAPLDRFPEIKVIKDGAEAPVDALAEEMEAALGENRRLLAAINRGQLERLDRFLKREPRFEELRPVIASAVEQLQLKVEPTHSGSDTALVLVLDLGLVDTLSDKVLTPLLDRLCEVRPDGGIAGVTLEALKASQRELREDSIRREIVRGFGALRDRSVHVTMRQLWSLGAFLLTGWRLPGCKDPLSIQDSIAARLYSEDSGLCLIDRLRRMADPALRPRPKAATLALRGELAPLFRQIDSLRPFVPSSGALAGPATLRVAATYNLPEETTPSLPTSVFEQALKELKRGVGWRKLPSASSRLISGVFRELDLPVYGGRFPRWQQLSYDARYLPEATMVANEVLDPSAFLLGLPRPSAMAEEALGDAWAPPELFFAPGPVGAGAKTPGSPLRLDPSLFARLYAEGAKPARPLPATRVEVLRRWLAQIVNDHSPDSDQLWLASRRHQVVQALQHDALAKGLVFG
jgi:hypothetical protein